MLQIYITDLAAYNGGALVGRWVQLPCEEEELTTTINEILSIGATAVDGSNHEEWFITDYEWDDISLFAIDEYEDIYKLNNNLQLLNGTTTTQLKAIKFLLDNGISKDLEDGYYRSDDVVIYELTNMESVAYDLLQDLYNIDNLPSIITNNIDYEAIGRELELDGAYSVVGDDVYEYHGWATATLEAKNRSYSTTYLGWETNQSSSNLPL